MAEYTGQGIFKIKNPVQVESYASVAGAKEGKGPLAEYFDEIIDDSHFGCATWEQAESKFQLEAVSLAVRKRNLVKEDIDLICSGDLINQCTGSSYGLRDLEIPAVVLKSVSESERDKVYITGGCIGKIADMGINDMTNMGSAMAPAGAETIKRYLKATGTVPSDYDYIITGDLGEVGSTLTKQLLMNENIDISPNHRDCGCMIFDNEKQDTHCGGSGCGCSASVLCGYFLPKLESGEIKNILFLSTGALMSPVTVQQGETIPAIAHLVHIERK